MTSTLDLTINQGETWNPVVNYTQPHLIVKAISAITKSGQAVVTSTHGLAVDWRVWVVGVLGMTRINHRREDVGRLSKAYRGYYVDSTHLRLDVDSTRFGAYTSGGELVYNPPVDLTGSTARMQIRPYVESPDADILLSLTTANGGISLGGANGTISLLASAAATAALDFDTAVYDLEVIDGSGLVTRLLSGMVTLSKEVTR